MKIDKMKKVLVALDYDPTAQKVAESGILLGKAMKADVAFLHVIAEANYYSSLEFSPITGFSGNMDMINNDLNSVEGLKNVSQNYLERLKHHLGNKNVQTVVREGDFADTIIKTAKELHADIIVIGSHSRKWLENIVMGSVTEKVLRHTSIPLFIVPTKKV
jgi:nucleotide-binding universal stress UspA family protein